MNFADWLLRERLPTDLYELLGAPLFDPDRQRLLELVHAAYAELLRYQNHEDRVVVDRVVRLQGELGRAEEVFSDPAKTCRYQESLLPALREAYADACRATGGHGGEQNLLEWMKRQGVHPSQFAMLAHAIAPGDERVPGRTAEDTAAIAQDGDEQREGYLLQAKKGVRTIGLYIHLFYSLENRSDPFLPPSQERGDGQGLSVLPATGFP
jgi:hypothetical protein